MEDLLEDSNEIQEIMGRSYGVPEELDEADLQAGEGSTVPLTSRLPAHVCLAVGTASLRA